MANEPRYADAVAVAVAPSPMNRDKSRAKIIEKAMSDAVTQAIADGISPTDPEMKVRIMEARERIVRGS